MDNPLVQRYKILAKYHKHLRNFAGIYEPVNSFPRRVAFFLIDVALWFLKQCYILVNPLLKSVEIGKVDIVVFGTCDVDISRSRNLWKILEGKGYKVRYLIPEKIPPYKIITYRLKTDKKIPSEIFLQALTAEYIFARYNPKVICLFHQNNVMPSLMRQAALGKAKTVFIPHGVTSHLIDYSSFDFDYYMAFGEGSANNIRMNALRVGNTKIVKTGSISIEQSMKFNAIPPGNDFLFFSAWDIGRIPDSTRNFFIVMEFAKYHPEYNILIKLHPIENGKFVLKHSSSLPNVKVFDKSVTLKEAIEKATLIITTISNASIEAALMGRPTVIVNNKPIIEGSTFSLRNSDQYLQMERFFLPRARNSNELHERILEMLSKYNHFTARCHDFVSYHYEHIYDAANYMAEVVESIFEDREDFPYDAVNEKINGLNKEAGL